MATCMHRDGCRMCSALTALIAGLPLIGGRIVLADTIHVPDDYPAIQQAIDAAVDGDEIIVHPGTYFEAIDCLGKAVTIRSTDPSDPSIVETTIIDGEGAYHVVQCVNGEGLETVLSGFTITGGIADGFYEWDVVGAGMFNYSSSPTVTYCVFTGNSVYSDYGLYAYGGGMFNYDCSPALAHCTFTGNSAGYFGGAGVANMDSSPTFTDCTFSNNSVSLTGFGGGGMLNWGSEPAVIGCTFDGNKVATGDGGGMANIEYSDPTVTDCTFSNNLAAVQGGGIYNDYGCSVTSTSSTFSGNSASRGGGMVFFCPGSGGDNPTVTDCVFSENMATMSGGGMFNYESSPTIIHSVFAANSVHFDDDYESTSGGGMHNQWQSNPTVLNCTFSGNSVYSPGNYDQGGGMYNYECSCPALINCTFSNNSADELGGGMFNCIDSSPVLANCTFSNNAADFGGALASKSGSHPALANCVFWGDLPNEIYDLSDSGTTATYSCIQGGWTGEGNIESNPLFSDPESGDYRLSSNSPCIDAADNSEVPPDELDLDGDGDTAEAIPFDLDDHPRFVDDPDTDDTGVGTPPIVDMGCYEFQVETCAADITGDSVVDVLDLLKVLAQWGTAGSADITGDGVVDVLDLLEVLAAWGPC